MKKSTDGKKDWLYTVKMGRQIYSDEEEEKDEFDTNIALRKWIGLPVTNLTKTNKKKKKKKNTKKNKRKG